MAATAAGGFRRWFGTGKSLSFVREHMRNRPNRNFLRFVAASFIAYAVLPEIAYARGGPASFGYAIFMGGLAAIGISTLVVATITCLCANKGSRIRVFLITFFAWPFWATYIVVLVPFNILVYFIAIPTICLWVVLLLSKIRQSTLPVENCENE